MRRRPPHALPIRPVFTGIVREVGVVESVQTTFADGCTLCIFLDKKRDDDLSAEPQRGDSIAVNGICLTLADAHEQLSYFDVSPETQARCLVGEWHAGKRVNIEPALTATTPLGGHVVCGHVDGIGSLLACESDGRFTRMDFEAPLAIGKFIAHKGALSIDGVSLTTNEVHDVDAQTRFSVTLVPHTLATTNLQELKIGGCVHLEVDPLARYVERLLDQRAEKPVVEK